ncbi:hypothetical protein FHS78_001499 [Parvibaculum indicum]|uniref:hypothetical protein n=1 Tax=Parvibaculum indicum TaxID=562969 RepID=UPI001422626D|nr:hypothetical protein [Parvibaculum indicum]NIJ41218.1 hypothetical protein [Parvibaculum indicum]
MMRRTQKMLIVFAVLLTAAAALSLVIAPDRPVRGAKAPDRPAAGIADPVVTLATGRMDQRLV